MYDLVNLLPWSTKPTVEKTTGDTHKTDKNKNKQTIIFDTSHKDETGIQNDFTRVANGRLRNITRTKRQEIEDKKEGNILTGLVGAGLTALGFVAKTVPCLASGGVAGIAIGLGLLGYAGYKLYQNYKEEKNWKTMEDNIPKDAKDTQFTNISDEEFQDASKQTFTVAGSEVLDRVYMTPVTDKDNGASGVDVRFYRVNSSQYDKTAANENDNTVITDYKGIEVEKYTVGNNFAPVMDKDLWVTTDEKGTEQFTKEGYKKFKEAVAGLSTLNLYNQENSFEKLIETFDINGDKNINDIDVAFMKHLISGKPITADDLETFGITYKHGRNLSESGKYIDAKGNEIQDPMKAVEELNKQLEQLKISQKADLNADNKIDAKDYEIMGRLAKGLLDEYKGVSQLQTAIEKLVAGDVSKEEAKARLRLLAEVLGKPDTKIPESNAETTQSNEEDTQLQPAA